MSMDKTKKHVEIHIMEHLSDDDLKKNRIFLKRAKEISKTKIVSAPQSNISMKINGKAGEPIKFSVILPEEELLRSFYMSFRFFYLQKEDANFLRLINILKRKAENDLAVKYLNQIRDQWTGALSRQQMQFRFNNTELTPNLLMDLWFNSHYFHDDDVKENKLGIMKTVLTNDVCRFLLVDAVYEATKAILKLAQTLKNIDK